MKPAVIIVDMLEDSYGKERNPSREEEKIVIPVRDFLKQCRELSVPIIFACDSFLPGDFIFRGRMKPHAIRGTTGVLPLSDLCIEKTDIILEKRRFSAFFKTDLDQTLRLFGVDTVVVGGINTHFCVLATAFDALCSDFNAIILEDMSAAYKQEIHASFMDAYRNNAIYPLFRIMTSSQFLDNFQKETATAD